METNSHRDDDHSARNTPAVNRRAFLSTMGAAGALAAASASGSESGAPDEQALFGAEREIQERAKRGAAQRAIKRASHANGKNLIVIIADTWRTDHLGTYGNSRAKTPNLDALASQGVVFENMYADGLPTIPARRVYHTGKSIVPGARWIPLPAGDVTMAQILKPHGYSTGLIADVYHYFKPDMNLHVGFDQWQWIRGQESDPYLGGPHKNFQPKQHMPPELWNPTYDQQMRQYMMNTQYWKGEDDHFSAQTVRTACQWLDNNTANSPFMLWIELFSPHEPWDPPERFAKMYREDYGFERFLFGYGVQSGQHKPDFGPFMPVIRDLYRAEVSYVDHCIGRLLEKVEALKLLDDTVIVFTTDHGTHLGELGYVQKQAALLNRCVMHLPLIIRHPDRNTAGKRVSALTSAEDLAPTCCRLLGIDDQDQMTGANMWSLVTGERDKLRDRTYTQFGNFGSVRDKNWHYFQHVKGKLRGAGPALYDLQKDPDELTNVLSQHPEIARELASHLADRFGGKIPDALARS